MWLLKMKMDKVQGLNEYINILPKSIQINTYNCKILFIKKLMGIFDKRITTFNQIDCEFSVISSRFISGIAKKVKINLEK